MKKRLFGLFSAIILVVILVSFVYTTFDFSKSTVVGCPFCQKKIVDKQLIFHGKFASVLATHKPAVPGHLLIIPNRHVVTFDLLEPSEIEEMGYLVKKVHEKYVSTLQMSDYLLIQKNGKTAGQTVPHVHIHVLPRSKKMNNLSFLFRFFLAAALKPVDEQKMKEYVAEFRFE